MHALDMDRDRTQQQDLNQRRISGYRRWKAFGLQLLELGLQVYGWS